MKIYSLIGSLLQIEVLYLGCIYSMKHLNMSQEFVLSFLFTAIYPNFISKRILHSAPRHSGIWGQVIGPCFCVENLTMQLFFSIRTEWSLWMFFSWISLKFKGMLIISSWFPWLQTGRQVGFLLTEPGLLLECWWLQFLSLAQSCSLKLCGIFYLSPVKVCVS